MTNLPQILTANTYYWSPASSAASRRRNEERRHAEVADFLTDLGFEFNGKTWTKGELEVNFEYSESCRNVYKHFQVWRNGKKSNITAIKKLLA